MPKMTTDDGLSLHYECHGLENKGPTLVFLNGMTQTTRHWASHCRNLRSTFRIVTYDARGQGQSDNPTSTPSLETHTDDLQNLLDHLDISEVDLVGFSHGARIALGFARRHPEYMRRLVLTSATAEPTALARTIVRSWRELLDQGGLPALAWASLPVIVGERFLEQHEKLLDNIVRASVERNSEEGTRHLLDGLMTFPTLDDLAGDITIPTLVISADADPLVPTDGAAKLARLCDGDHKVVENCGHTIPIERPDRFQRHVVKFLG